MEKLLTAQKVAEILDCHPQSIYRNKELPYVKIPGIGKRFRISELDEYLEQRTIKSLSLLNQSNPAKSFKLTKLDEFDKLYLKETKGGNCGSMNGKKTRWNYGFGSVYVRKTRQGMTRWYIDYLVNGKRIREVVKNAQERAEAILYLKERVSEVFNNSHRQINQRKELTLEEMADCYIEDYAKQNKKSWKQDLIRLEAHLKPHFGHLRIDEVTPIKIEKYRAERLKKGIAKSTINRELAIMKKMYNLAIDWNLTVENPVKRVRFFSEKDNLRERILSREEEASLLEASAEHLKPIIIVALNTGMRLGEILSLRWCQVDLAHLLLRVENTKSGTSRSININSVLRKTMSKMKAENSSEEYLFVNPETGKPFTTVKTAFKAACRRAGIMGLRFHDLRHTFATRLVEKGVDLITVKNLLGHSTVKVTERYTHPNQNLKKEAVEALVQKDKKVPKKSDDLAHIWHMEKNKRFKKGVNSSISIN